MTGEGLTIVAIDDDFGDAEILRRRLQEIPDLMSEYVHFVDPNEAVTELATRDADVILLDYQLGAQTGLEVLEAIRSSGDDRPVVVLTGRGDETVAVEVMKRGAQDYLVKHATAPESLRHAIANAVEKVALQRELASKHRELQEEKRILEETLRKLQETQAQLLHADKMASIGQLAAGLAHEINNPLSFISANLDTLGKYLEDLKMVQAAYDDLLQECRSNDSGVSHKAEQTARIREEADVDYILSDLDSLVAESVEGVRRAQQIVADLKDFSHLDRPGLVEVNINELLDKTINVAWHQLKPKAELIREYGGIPTAICHGGKLGQLFLHLLINAAQAIEDHGTITVRTGTEADYIWVEVVDTGCGIPEEDLNRIFDPFFTTKEVGQGTGLGLNIAFSIVQAHEGRISVQSNTGEGATFRVELRWLDQPPRQIALRLLPRRSRPRRGSRLWRLHKKKAHCFEQVQRANVFEAEHGEPSTHDFGD